MAWETPVRIFEDDCTVNCTNVRNYQIQRENTIFFFPRTEIETLNLSRVIKSQTVAYAFDQRAGICIF